MKSRMARVINNLDMWKKQLLSFVLILLIPYGVIFALVQSMHHIVLDNANTQAGGSVERMSLRIEKILSIAVSISSAIAYDANLKSFITADYENQFERVHASWSNGNLSSYLVEHTYEIDGLFLYSDAYSVLNTGYIKNTPDSVKNSDWYRRAREGERSPFWAYIPNDSFSRRNQLNLALCRSVFKGNEFLGVLCIYINDETLMSIADQEDFKTLICAPPEQIVAASDARFVGRSLGDAGIRPEELSGGGPASILHEGQSFTALTRSISIPETRGGVDVIALYSGDQILAQPRRVTAAAYRIILVGFACSAAVILLLSKLLTDRLVRVSGSIHHVANGELDYQPLVDGADEIGRLSADLSAMLENLRRLINENYEIRLQKQRLETNQKEIQLQVLNSQINPHFLFNTLEGIRMKAVIGGDGEVAGAIKMLSSLLRKSLYTGAAPISLSEELGFIEDYLSLQGLRFGESLRYHMDIQVDARQTILPFLLQPLVENAIRHGVEESDRAQSYVLVEARREADRMLINIVDNGAGMEAHTLAALTESMRGAAGAREDGFGGHIGIRNVNQRIKLHYGEPYGLEIQSTPGKGTIVAVTLPWGGAIAADDREHMERGRINNG